LTEPEIVLDTYYYIDMILFLDTVVGAITFVINAIYLWGRDILYYLGYVKYYLEMFNPL